ncbi:MBL fold metallo-hydrolase [Marinilactibacillus psychrotolerans]|uniref:MBL fold metallo-hydrolase n=1 Tax=Marinilactibacillus psychrotolerans TaxID=191770 RepID=A0A511GZB5_9LACT|nr:MBL fold metallo-hydrolase [Marinilactibacillus psychrotolerans]TLQ04552.1 MBL fold metallo-hydrolase [Marinilactibacillus psychrotolerans]SDC52229.1 Phosphoribosyl 1,2-cyclic phosphodiesterase [Marinilactibacillus psychrotolerans]GEL66504.1 metallo-hydrolase [Marinilactibacillus psychrotolerans]GEQ33553.1 metal-dependent hydrolase [Marinilactibacillus psychrotolerans]GEQ35320.1 metal-dependent hydrolase [Marinilactibacillus psychrotolerans]
MLEVEQSGLKISILASGSTGNITYIESDQIKILVDCGFSGKKAIELLKQIDRRPEDLNAILVTHEHSDHIKGVGILARKYNLDIYANQNTWKAMEPKLGKLNLEQKHHFDMNKTMTIGDIDVSSFGVSHDAVDPQFYTFQKNNKRFVMLTDTGYVSDNMRDYVKNADAYLFESNHDLSMLRMGRYPWSLKQRIIGDKGHLSNEDGALALAEIVGDRTKRVYLGHLSKENNLKEIAHSTVEDILKQKGTGIGHDYTLFDTDPETAAPLFRL